MDLAAWAPSLQAEGGPAPEAIIPSGGVELAALVSGYFAANAGLPPPATAACLTLLVTSSDTSSLTSSTTAESANGSMTWTDRRLMRGAVGSVGRLTCSRGPLSASLARALPATMPDPYPLVERTDPEATEESCER